jgi:hypothetical protein
MAAWPLPVAQSQARRVPGACAARKAKSASG